ncbi:MAG: lytic transglycosylase domain-containing protein [Treponema sp.]|nr:lytic transglycosylase domain-containing protein [Treponema sp.]
MLLVFCHSCSGQQIQTDFYKGLRIKAELSADSGSAKDKSAAEADVHFQNALNSANAYVCTAAAAELLHRLYEGQKFPASVMTRLKRSAPPSWAAAFNILDSGPDQIKDKALPFLLSSGRFAQPFSPKIFPDEAAQYVLRECSASEIFSPVELAAINGNILASQSRFSEALVYFRTALEDPSIFIKYPDLIARLGRSFQYAGAGSEGIDLFLGWEKDLPSDSPAQFQLLFFAGRMARHLGRFTDGIDYFRKALPVAPDSVQSDACIWYILDCTSSARQENFSQTLEELLPSLHDKSYCDDILDAYISANVQKGRWADIAAVFPYIHDYADSDSVARYAYIIARALEEGLLQPEEAVGYGAGGRDTAARAYLEMAYQAGSISSYYRMQSAALLNKPFLSPPAQAPAAGSQPGKKPKDSAAMEFIMGFFKNNAAEYAPVYIKYLEKELTADEKRSIAKELTQAGLYSDSIRLLYSYLDQDGVGLPAAGITRDDLELYYPRPFKDYIEKCALENGLPADLLYALIRTESSFQSSVISSAGAVGLSQLLPSTAEEMAGRILRRGGPDFIRQNNAPSDTDSPITAALHDPEANIYIGAFYLNYLNDRLGSNVMAVLAYNGGMNRVRRWRSANSKLSEDLFLESVEYPETREYGRKVLAAQAVYKFLYY